MSDEFVPRRPNSAVQDEILVKMLHEIGRNDHKATSFRMWDTLVITPFSRPEDMFLFMEDDFALLNTGKKTFTELRMEAQQDAEKKYSLRSNVTLRKIYDIFEKISGITPAGRDRLMARECDLLRHFSFPRRMGKLLFDKAKEIAERYDYNFKCASMPALYNQTLNRGIKEMLRTYDLFPDEITIEYMGSERKTITKPKREFITCHTGRRTYISVMLENGMDVYDLISTTGHTNIDILKHYIDFKFIISKKIIE